MDDLKEGRELDAMVGKALGWTRGPALNPPNRSWPLRGPRTWRAPGSTIARALPRFSSDNAAAMALESQLSRVGRVITITHQSCGDWYVLIAEDDRIAMQYVDVAEGEGETFPLAMCRAALSLMDHEAEERIWEPKSAAVPAQAAVSRPALPEPTP